MKRIVVALAACAVLSLAASAQTLKVVSVNMERVYAQHHKTTEFQSRLQQTREELETKVKSLQEEGQGLVKTFNEQREQAQNAALTTDARGKAEEDARKTAEQIQQKQGEIQFIVQRTQQAANERGNSHRMSLMDEIGKTVQEIAKRRGAQLAFDSSGRTFSGSFPLVWAANAEDITEEVIKEVNKDAPPAPAPAAASPAPITPPTQR